MVTSLADSWIIPDWPAPSRVRAMTSTRTGGVSTGPFSSLNLAHHVDDESRSVDENRARLKNAAGLPEEPRWLCQVHGVNIVEADAIEMAVNTDGSFTRSTGPVCAVLTADCLPVLLCDRSGTVVAAVHAGWRGLVAGVLDAAIGAMAASNGSELMAWLGPAIGPASFVVGNEVRDAFVAKDAIAAAAFVPVEDNKWTGDLYLLARQRLASQGILEIYGGEFCTYQDEARFFSYRRDGNTGRMATLIWIQH